MNEDRDSLIFYAHCEGMNKARIGYLFNLSIPRINRILRKRLEFLRMREGSNTAAFGDFIRNITPIRTPLIASFDRPQD